MLGQKDFGEESERPDGCWYKGVTDQLNVLYNCPRAAIGPLFSLFAKTSKTNNYVTIYIDIGRHCQCLTVLPADAVQTRIIFLARRLSKAQL